MIRRSSRFAALLMLATLLPLASCRRASDLPVLFEIPAATLVADSGVVAPLARFQGKTTVYAFIFTRCLGICPTMVQSMKVVEEGLPANLPAQFVLISVDPAYDTPEVLREFRKKHEVGERWVFLTGDAATISKLSIEGFKLAAPKAGGGPDEPIVHSSKFVLADTAGKIRGYYNSFDKAELAKLTSDLKLLAEE